MPQLRGARRYAQAIFELARDQDRLETWSAELARLSSAAADPDFVSLMEARKLSMEQRLAAAQQVLPGLDSQAANLVGLLIARGRVRLLQSIAQAYHHLLDAAQGVEEAEVVTAAPLAPGDLEALRTQLEQMRARRIRLTHRLDDGLLGGIVLRFGDHLVDGSLRTRLEQMRRAMAGA